MKKILYLSENDKKSLWELFKMICMAGIILLVILLLNH